MSSVELAQINCSLLKTFHKAKFDWQAYLAVFNGLKNKIQFNARNGANDIYKYYSYLNKELICIFIVKSIGAIDLLS